MRRRLRPAFLTLLILGLISCGEDTPQHPSTDQAQGSSAQEQVESTELNTARDDTTPEDLSLTQIEGVNEAWLGDLDVMADRRLIRVLTVYSVGRYYLDGPEEKGMVYEMFKQFEKSVNKSLNSGHLKTHVVFIPVARSQLIPALLEGRGDIISAGLTITPERAEQVAFSKPMSKPVSEILVTGPSAPVIDSIEDLSGQTLYLRESSSYRESVETLNLQFRAEGKAEVIIHPLSELLEDDDLIEMVNAGLLDWAIVDQYKTQLWEGVFDKLVVRDDIIFRSDARLAYAFRKNSPKLEAAINNFLKTHKQGTLLGNILTNRYLRDYDWAGNALEQSEYQRFQNLEEIFKTYGEKYGIDYLMVAAQGYQESRLKQTARSHTGAVGVMQLLPSTAADSNVGIKNISEVDSNIHAGVKYLEFLRSRYFSDPEIDELNKTLLALAAYNAGPSRMINLRNKAKKQGKNPNIWFDNVEVVAAKEIGRETVQYVANIYKYYLSYRLTAEQHARRKAARKKAGITSP
ncbi:MAG: transporter substrate-binding domain-containing protein [Halioglobus sp.]